MMTPLIPAYILFGAGVAAIIAGVHAKAIGAKHVVGLYVMGGIWAGCAFLLLVLASLH